MQGAAGDRGIRCTSHEFKEINRRDSPTWIPNRSRSIHDYDLSFLFFFLFFFFHGKRMGPVLVGSRCRLQDSVIHRLFPGAGQGYVRTIFGSAKEIWMGIRITDDHVTSGLFFVWCSSWCSSWCSISFLGPSAVCVWNRVWSLLARCSLVRKGKKKKKN